MKILKKALPLCLLALALVIGVTLLTPKAEAAVVDGGTCGENLLWILDEQGILTISGTGPMTDYDTDWDSPSGSTHPWAAVAALIQTVDIKEGVTSIGAHAFYECVNLTYVTVPNSVTAIGEWAFYNCDSIVSVALPPNVSNIGGWAFYNCNSLTGIWVDTDNADYCCDASGVLFSKDGTQLIQAPGAISGYYQIPYGVTEIGPEAFCNCDELRLVSFPDSLKTIGSGSFAGCNSLLSVDIPDSVTSIQIEAFCDCAQLQTVTVGSGVNSLVWYTFSGCPSLWDVKLGDGIKYITNGVFSDCSALYNITLPGGLTGIGDDVFYGCEQLGFIFFNGTMAQWEQIEIGSNNEPLKNASLVTLEADADNGDLNEDSLTDNSDVLVLLWHTLFPVENPIGINVDYNEDGLVDNGDVLILLWHCLFPEENPL